MLRARDVAAGAFVSVLLVGCSHHHATAPRTLTTTTTGVPGQPAASADAPYQVDVQWNAVADADGYKLFRRPDGVGAKYVLIATLRNADLAPTDPRRFSDFPPQMITYDYKVKAFNSYGDSPQPTELVVVPQ